MEWTELSYGVRVGGISYVVVVLERSWNCLDVMFGFRMSKWAGFSLMFRR